MMNTQRLVALGTIVLSSATFGSGCSSNRERPSSDAASTTTSLERFAAPGADASLDPREKEQLGEMERSVATLEKMTGVLLALDRLGLPENIDIVTMAPNARAGMIKTLALGDPPAEQELEDAAIASNLLLNREIEHVHTQHERTETAVSSLSRVGILDAKGITTYLATYTEVLQKADSKPLDLYNVLSVQLKVQDQVRGILIGERKTLQKLKDFEAILTASEMTDVRERAPLAVGCLKKIIDVSLNITEDDVRDLKLASKMARDRLSLK